MFRSRDHHDSSGPGREDTSEGSTQPPLVKRSRVTAIAALAAASALALSSCGYLASLNRGGGSAGSGASPSASQPSVTTLEGTTSTAFGTDGMAPIGTLATPMESAAMGIDADTASDQRWAEIYAQKPQWGPCEDPAYASAECATVKVPLMWNAPDQGSIDLLISKLATTGTGEYKGSLLINPGGPGGSGNQIVAEYGSSTGTDALRGSYDYIGFDPRGVKDSSGIVCLDDKQTDEYLSATFDTDTEDGRLASEESFATMIEACKANSGELLQYLDTWSAARDMDVIRAVVGSEKLDYLGYSYGTYLGASYAELYPERTGHIVLDAAVDPSITGDEMAAGQAAGFEDSVRAFVTWCQGQADGSCPLEGTVDQGVQKIRDFLDQTAQKPLTMSDGRELTGSLAVTGVLVPMYSSETWPMLAMALQLAFAGNGDLLGMFADLSNERNSDGSYASNGMFAITAVNCLDRLGVIDPEWVQTESERLEERYPTFGGMLGGGGISCEQWPAKPVRVPASIHASGSSTIVVIGTTGDPATPYPWSEALAEQLDNSVLLTFEGYGHTAYGRSGGCIEEAVDNYFINDVTPTDGLTCSPPA
ncbi:MAG: alpha/beta hydrolase [Dermabacter sp.]|nr:alpha/beta hydrolase [Dermabacter sp.]